jgi:hypothetical protein
VGRSRVAIKPRIRMGSGLGTQLEQLSGSWLAAWSKSFCANPAAATRSLQQLHPIATLATQELVDGRAHPPYP